MEKFAIFVGGFAAGFAICGLWMAQVCLEHTKSLRRQLAQAEALNRQLRDALAQAAKHFDTIRRSVDDTLKNKAA